MIKKTILPNPPETKDANLNSFLWAIKNRLESPYPLHLGSHSVGELNALSKRQFANHVVSCSNGNAGDECLAYCDGFNWYVIELGSEISQA